MFGIHMTIVLRVQKISNATVAMKTPHLQAYVWVSCNTNEQKLTETHS